MHQAEGSSKRLVDTARDRDRLEGFSKEMCDRDRDAPKNREGLDTAGGIAGAPTEMGKGTPKSGGKHGSMGPSLEEAGGQVNTRDVLRTLQSHETAHTEVTAIGSLTGTDTTVVSN